MKRFAYVCMTMCLGMGLMLANGCSDDSDKVSSFTFKVTNSGSPADPQICIPERTAKLKMELFQEPSVTGKAVNLSDSSSGSSASSDASEDPSEEASAKDSVEASSATDVADTQGRLLAEDVHIDYALGTRSDDKDKKNKVTKTYYSTSVDYDGGEPELTINDVEEGAWILRITARDSGGRVLAHYQKGLNSSGGNLTMSGWLEPGAPPEGYLYAAHTSDGNISRVSLYSGLVDTIKLSTGNPAYLFAKKTEVPGFDDVFYATTGGVNILSLTPKFTEKIIDVEDVPFVKNGTHVRSAENAEQAVISFFNDGMVRFFDYTEASSYDYLYTGSGAGYISHVINGDQVWVCNENSQDLSMVDMSERRLVYDNLRLGSDVPRAAEPNPENSRIWILGSRSSDGVVRVIDFSDHDLGGKNWGEFTTNLASPQAIYLNGDEWACVTDGTRDELIFLDAGELDENGNIKEILRDNGTRMKLPGGGSQILSDGDRLYILQDSDIAVIDLDTKSIARTYPIGEVAHSIMRVK